MKNQIKLVNFRAFSIGFSAALLALACGSDDKGDTGSKKEEVAPANVPTDIAPKDETCADNPLLAGCTPPAQAAGESRRDQSNARRSSAIRSLTSSTPTDSRMSPSLIPREARMAAGNDAWVINPGCSMRLSTPPRLSANENR